MRRRAVVNESESDNSDTDEDSIVKHDRCKTTAEQVLITDTDTQLYHSFILSDIVHYSCQW